jgi:branched-chain amino acid transport system permease protein
VASAFFAGVAGGLYAGCIGVMAPAKFGFMKSIEILVMVVLGGMGSMLGSVISATVLTILPEALRAVSDYRMVVYAVVLILVMIFRPEGLLGDYDFSMSRVIERIMNHGKRPEDFAPATTPAVEAVATAVASGAPSATTEKDTGKEASTHE